MSVPALRSQSTGSLLKYHRTPREATRGLTLVSHSTGPERPVVSLDQNRQHGRDAVTLLFEPPDRVAERFWALRDEWHAKAAFLSSSNARALMRPYQEVIGLGRMAVPLLLQDLAESGTDWFWALKAIAGEDPVPVGDRGDVEAMTAAWLEWGAQRGLI